MRETNDTETAALHVVEARRIIERQHLPVDHLIADGHDASDAQYTLDLFTRTLAIFEEHLRKLEAARGNMDQGSRLG